MSLTKLLFCCAVAGAMYACNADPSVQTTNPNPATAAPNEAPEGMVYVEGAEDGDVESFYIDATEVTVGEFAQFIEATGYRTEADSFGWSGVFSTDEQAWIPVDGANWRYPLGKNEPAASDDQPVTQVSLKDARAYARWRNAELPTEREWMWAATQGGEHRNFPWGEAMLPDGEYLGNWWQGPFPYRNEVADGYEGIAAVKSFPATPNGLYDISGNVWEWTATINPADGQSVIKGGSFLCSTSYCTGFDLQQRQYTPADSGLNHLGFRTIRRATAKK